MIPTPVAGTLAYIEALDEVQVFNVPAGWTPLLSSLSPGYPFLSLSGGTMTGSIDLGGNRLDNIGGGAGGLGGIAHFEFIGPGGNLAMFIDVDDDIRMPAGTANDLLRLGEQGLQLFNAVAGGEPIARFEALDGAYVVGNTIGSGRDIPTVDIFSLRHSQVAFVASESIFSTRSSDITSSQEIQHFRLASADSNPDPARRISVRDEFFGTGGGTQVMATLSAGWWNFHRQVSSLEIKTEIAPWNPAALMPSVVPSPKQSGSPAAISFDPASMLDLTPVTYSFEPAHLLARESDPGPMLGYILEDLMAQAPWLVDENGSALDRDSFVVAVIELLRDLRDRVAVLEP